MLANAGKQSVRGFEFDVNRAPSQALRLSFATTYLDPEYDDFVGGVGPDGPTDLSGQRPAGIHEWSTNTAGTYSFPFAGANGYVRVEHVYEDEYLLSAFPSVAQAGSFSGYPNTPRTYGLTLRKNFD